MGYLPDFEYDIFISYTHLDNHAPEGEKGWVDQFHEWLVSGLLRRFGRDKIVVWRDNQLHGHTLFEERIPEVIKSSALLLALNSQHYIKSEYCQKEVQWFYDCAKKSSYGLAVQGEKRLFNILLNNIHYSLWPETISGTSAFPLHDAPQESTERGEPLDPRELQFHKQLRKIIDAIELTLNAFPKLYEKCKSDQSSSTIQVFVASVADSLKTTRTRLIKDLAESGIEITTEVPPPWDNTTHTDHVSLLLQKSSLSIHLLDNSVGPKIEDLKSTTYPHRQVELALKSSVSQIIWVPKILKQDDSCDENSTTLLDILENGPRNKNNFTFMRSDYPEFYQTVRQFLNEMKRIPQAGAENKAILLDSHQKDQLFALELGAYLAREGLEVVFNQESRNPVETLYNFEKSLEFVDHLVIVFGIVDRNWVKQRIQKITQFMATHIEQFKIEDCWLYLVPPEKQVDELPSLPRLLNISMLDGSHSKTFEPEIFNPILNSCRDRRRV